MYESIKKMESKYTILLSWQLFDYVIVECFIIFALFDASCQKTTHDH